MRVSVFGGSAAKPHDPIYQDALALGDMLGIARYTVLTGGYMGTMEAISRGVAESGGYVIGVTCDEIETWRPASANPWISKELRYPTIRERLFTLIEECEAAMALPGGVGTLAEIVTMWSHMHTGAIPKRPLILVGPGWSKLIAMFFVEFDAFVPDEARKLVYFADDAEAAFDLLTQLVSSN